MSAVTSPDAADRALRADAKRNRETLLVCAGQAFAEHGTAASLEDVARRAGVGIGTLYRHFPTRDALVEAAYRHGVEQLAMPRTNYSPSKRPTSRSSFGCSTSSVTWRPNAVLPPP